MDDHVQSFLGDILANPHDDAPRLIFADWIEDHAAALPPEVRDRGQLIRVQYALEGREDDDPRRAMLQTRERALIQTHLRAWAYGFITYIHRPAFRRGFVEGVTLNLDAHVQTEHPEALAPVRRLAVTNTPFQRFATPMLDAANRERLATAARLPALSRAEDLDLGDLYFPDADAAVGWLAGLTAPRLTSLTVRAEMLPAARPLLPRLRRLAVRGPWLDAREGDGLEARRLESVSLHGTTPNHLANWLRCLDGPPLRRVEAPALPLRGSDTPPLFPPPLAARLEYLDLSNGNLDLTRLTDEGPFPSLRRLVLRASLVGSADLAHFAYGDATPALRSLNLGECRLSEQCVGVLLGSPLLAQLEALHLGNNRIGPDAAFNLLPRLPHGLRTLDLSWNPVGDLAAGQLARSGASDTLEALDLSYCGLGPDAAYQLLLFPPDAPLVALNLGTNRIDDDAFRTLLESPAFGRLEALDVSNNGLTDAAVAALEAWPRLRDLSLLSLHGNAITADALDRLRGGFRGLLL